MSDSPRRNVWAIADLHLSFAREDHRERFAGRWRDHAETIAREWQSVVRRNDLVLMPGDISMARNHREVQPDLAWLDRLPGIKILSAGNHDGWWNGTKKIRPMLRKSLRVVDGDAIEVNGVIVCGARGAAMTEEDNAPGQKALVKETTKLKIALEAALLLIAETQNPIVALWHYPPFDPHGVAGPIVSLLESAGVAACVYGHLHAEGQWSTTVQGEISGVLYRCVAADAIGFRPLRIL